jgi:DNA polymerase III delta prime subunit
MTQCASIPWIEKYRPDEFDNIVLDPTNRIFFKNILHKKYFPNLLFYGPPGTGKTTTILNLISEFQKTTVPCTTSLYPQTRDNISGKHKENVIHLNASDERGIDIIRNQIHQFVKSNHLFEPGLKFVVLDEVDYMTKNAQQALKTLLQTCRLNVRFCLICNYISKIDESLQNEFVCVRFNQLPKTEIYRFIQNITEKENIDITPDEIETIQTNYNSDIRSMINFIQLHTSSNESQNMSPLRQVRSEALAKRRTKDLEDLPAKQACLDGVSGRHPDYPEMVYHRRIMSNKIHIIRSDHWNKIHQLLLQSKVIDDNLVTDTVELYIHKLSIQYNMDKRNILNMYFNYVIRHFPEVISAEFLSIVEHATHDTECIPIKHVLEYVCANLIDYYSKL